MLAVNATSTGTSARAVATRIKAMASELGKSRTFTISLPTPETNKLSWFDVGTARQPARPVLTVDKVVRAAALEAIKAKYSEAMRAGENPNMQNVMTVGANAARRVFVQRLETSGGDMTLAPLSPRYLARKIRMGLDRRIGVATGAMLAAVKRGFVIVTKVT